MHWVLFNAHSCNGFSRMVLIETSGSTSGSHFNIPAVDAMCMTLYSSSAGYIMWTTEGLTPLSVFYSLSDSDETWRGWSSGHWTVHRAHTPQLLTHWIFRVFCQLKMLEKQNSSCITFFFFFPQCMHLHLKWNDILAVRLHWAQREFFYCIDLIIWGTSYWSKQVSWLVVGRKLHHIYLL